MLMSETALSEFNKYSIKFRTVTVYVQLRATTNPWKMKAALSTAVLLLAISPFAFAQSFLVAQEFKTLRKQLGINKKSDILFLLDTSASVWPQEFEYEKEFVINFLNTITVSFEEVRVEVIPFGERASLYIDGVSNPSLDKDKCDLVQKLKKMPVDINGFHTNTKSAFQLAYDVCVGKYSRNKRGPLNQVRTAVILIIAGRWNWPFHDSNPIPIAQKLHAANVEVFAIGVGISANLPDLQKLVKDPAKQAFLLKHWGELYELSRFVRGGK